MRALSLALLLAACSADPDDPAQVTADEERRLDEAAATLDAREPNGTDPPATAE